MIMIHKVPLFLLVLILVSCSPETDQSIKTLALSNYRPVSVYNIPATHVEKPVHPIIDMHSHDYAGSREEIDRWVETMKKFGIEKTVILSTRTGTGFDEVVSKYSGYPDRFELWCGIDFTGYDSARVLML